MPYALYSWRLVFSMSRQIHDSERLVKQTYSVFVSLPEDRVHDQDTLATRKWHLSKAFSSQLTRTVPLNHLQLLTSTKGHSKVSASLTIFPELGVSGSQTATSRVLAP